jgi:aryl-alcohol dehydrogenase-like predicted oxidoreductase
MRYRPLGNSGLHVSVVGLGCNNFGSRLDLDATRAVVDAALDAGITFFDTADVYGNAGGSETLLGQILKGRRDEVVLATKCGLVVDDPVTYAMHRDGTPDHVRTAIDASLRRLQTDHVDLYQLHRVDPDVPVEETWGAMGELVQAGKVRAIGMSEATTDELDRAHQVHPVATLQSELSLWTRDPLEAVLPWCREHDTAFIPFAPLGRGYLTGQLNKDSFGDDDFRSRNPRFTREALEANLAIVDRVREVAGRHDATPGQVALAWTLAQDERVVPIPGTKRPERVDENAGAAALALTADDLAELDAMPAAVGARY